MKILEKRIVYLLAFFLLFALAIPPLHSLAMRIQAKSHVTAGCKAFMEDGGQKYSYLVGIFQNEFSKAALKDLAYLPIAKASDSLDADLQIATRNGFSTEWRDSLSTIQGLCWSIGELGLPARD
jgi:hypothetical protein